MRDEGKSAEDIAQVFGKAIAWINFCIKNYLPDYHPRYSREMIREAVADNASGDYSRSDLMKKYDLQEFEIKELLKRHRNNPTYKPEITIARRGRPPVK